MGNDSVYNYTSSDRRINMFHGGYKMKHIKNIQKPCIRSGENTACGECQASCQSACKTSCTVANQKCVKTAK